MGLQKDFKYFGKNGQLDHKGIIDGGWFLNFSGASLSSQPIVLHYRKKYVYFNEKSEEPL
jgi:hypothetical protein